MSPRISIRAAAERFGARPAIVTAREVLSFTELAARVEDALPTDLSHGTGGVIGARPIVAPPRLDVLVDVLAHVEAGIPVALLHPRLTPVERVTAEAVVADATFPRGGDALAVFFTSGTTGTPKGAVLSHRAFVAAAEQASVALALSPDDRWLLAMPLAHVGGFSIVTRALVCGLAVVMPDAEERFDESSTIEVIEAHGVTIASLVPTMLHRLLRRVPRWDPPAHLRAIVLGGAGAPPALLDEARVRRWPVSTTYGLTESCAMVTLQPLGTAPDVCQGAGRPLLGNEVRVCGDEGALEVRGPALMDGYVGLPRAVAFTDDGWLRTGDLARIDAEGRVHVLARRTDLVVTGGENVYPAEVEAVLAAHPLVAHAAVVGVPDDEWGERVVAVIVPSAPDVRDVVVAAVHAFARDRLAAHKRPKALVVVDALPLGPSGKVDRRAVKALVGVQLTPT
ncbi:AMP-binding protein [Myxococcota bacterium]|nr:AMP-binding protein [Myxococcota bacterium]